MLARGSSVASSNELVNSPLLAVIAVLIKLGPREGSSSLGGVDQDRAFVRRGDDVVGGCGIAVVPLELQEQT